MKNNALLRILVFGIVGYFFLHYIGTTDETSIFVKQPIVWVIFGAVLLIYIAGEISIAALKNVLYKSLNEEARENFDAQTAIENENRFAWWKKTYKKLLGSKPIEKEGEIVLDHNYDGIRELDNKLPPWWVYGFYATIIFAVVYLVRYHVFDGANQVKEYEIAVAQAKLDLEEYKRTAKDLIDVNTVELLTEASDLKAGEAIFVGNCAACHKVSGAGGIGPNLTDEYWILGGGIKNVFNTISEGGRAGKGMVAWKTDLKPSEMAQVASYVLSLGGTNPEDPKAAEGEIWVDELENKEDSTMVVIDSTLIDSIKVEEVSIIEAVNDAIE